MEGQKSWLCWPSEGTFSFLGSILPLCWDARCQSCIQEWSAIAIYPSASCLWPLWSTCGVRLSWSEWRSYGIRLGTRESFWWTGWTSFPWFCLLAYRVSSLTSSHHALGPPSQIGRDSLSALNWPKGHIFHFLALHLIFLRIIFLNPSLTILIILTTLTQTTLNTLSTLIILTTLTVLTTLTPIFNGPILFGLLLRAI